MDKMPDTRNIYVYNEFHDFGDFFRELQIKITVQLLSMPFEAPQLALKKAIMILRQKGIPDQEIDVTPKVCDDQEWIDRVHRKFEKRREREWSDEEAG